MNKNGFTISGNHTKLIMNDYIKRKCYEEHDYSK